MALECQICGGPAESRMDCGGCGAMHYCSDKHRRRHARLGHDAEECTRMAAQLQRREELQQLSFEFAYELTAELDAGSMCEFLQRHGLHGLSLWRRQCACSGSQPWGSLAAPVSMSAAACAQLLSSQQLPGPSEVASQPIELNSWADYYTFRRLPLSSPAALLLEAPLTLYLALRWAMDGKAIPNNLTIHILGPQKEVDAWPTFAELAALLPGHHIRLLLIGPDVPSELHGRSTAELGGAHVEFWSGLYHELHSELATQHSQPSLVFAPNAGLAAYKSWVPTLQALPPDVPLVVTDYAEEAALRAAAMLQAVTGRDLGLPVCVNPFRRPASSQGRDNALPSYSNGFIFGIVG